MEDHTQNEAVDQTPFYKRKAFIYLSVACIVLIVTGIAALFHKNYPGVKFKDFAAELMNLDMPPGGRRATLTLASGETIVLNEAADGELGEEAGLRIRKTGNGQLKYEQGVLTSENDESGFHTIATPKGGTYQVILADGSVIWLNAASKLKLPLDFGSTKERVIELAGEAYLEIAKDTSRPLKVITKRQIVQALGKDLNVSDYPDDFMATATAFDGTLRVKAVDINASSPAELTLKTGQQAIVDEGSIRSLKADTAEVRAWKNDLFVFNSEPLESIMKKISRWYDVDVVYDAVDPKMLFKVKISRMEQLSEILRQLELAGGIHFKLEAGKIVVTK